MQRLATMICPRQELSSDNEAIYKLMICQSLICITISNTSNQETPSQLPKIGREMPEMYFKNRSPQNRIFLVMKTFCFQLIKIFGFGTYNV